MPHTESWVIESLSCGYLKFVEKNLQALKADSLQMKDTMAMLVGALQSRPRGMLSHPVVTHVQQVLMMNVSL